MKRIAWLTMAAVIAVAGTALATNDGFSRIREVLSGYEEVTLTLSTEGKGTFTAAVGKDKIEYTLRYSDLEGTVTQAHIHLGARGLNGGISAFLCSNLGNGPAGTQGCPTPAGTVRGTIGPEDVIGPGGQGIAAGEFAELLAAMRAGVTYVNVHSTLYPGGEIRAQISADDHRGHD
jgi:hypothetical protein